MRAAWLRARAQLRIHARATIALALIAGLAGGMVLAAVAGARRTSSALPRFLAVQPNTPFSVEPSGLDAGDFATELAVVRDLPYVTTAVRLSAFIMAGSDPSKPSGWRRQLGYAVLDPPGFAAIGRPIVVHGRTPDPTRADEAAIDEELASRLGLRVGDRWRVAAYTTAQFGPAGAGVDVEPEGPAVDLLVTGIVRVPDDLNPVTVGQDNIYVDSSALYLTPAYWDRYGPDLARYGIVISAAVRDPVADEARFRQDVAALLGGTANVTDEGAGKGDTDDVRDSIRIEAGALAVFAAIAAVASVLLVGQALVRQAAAESVDAEVLAALGMTRRQRVATQAMRFAPTAVGSGLLAVLIAVALSPLTPIGIARRAELSPGVEVNVAVLAVGMALVALAVLGRVGVHAWRQDVTSRARRTPARAASRSRLSERIATAGGAPAVSGGVGMAFDRSSGAGLALRAAMVAAVATVAVAVTAASVLASFDALRATPARYGVTWDVSVGNFARAEERDAGRAVLEASPDVEAFAGWATGSALLDGHEVPVVLVEAEEGTLEPAVVSGVAPRLPDEIALGADTMAALDVGLGDTVTVSGDPSTPVADVTVVGQVLLNSAGIDSRITPGEGAALLLALVKPVAPELVPQVFTVRFAPGVDREAALARLEREFPNTVVLPITPRNISNLERVRELPTLLALLVALLGAGTIGHALVVSVRRNRRHVAVLKTLGFVRGQVSTLVACEATCVGLVALLGVPAGLALGRWVDRMLADAIGVEPHPVAPVAVVAAIALAAVVVVNLVALVPGWRAGRLRPAEALRTE